MAPALGLSRSNRRPKPGRGDLHRIDGHKANRCFKGRKSCDPFDNPLSSQLPQIGNVPLSKRGPGFPKDCEESPPRLRRGRSRSVDDDEMAPGEDDPGPPPLHKVRKGILPHYEEWRWIDRKTFECTCRERGARKTALNIHCPPSGPSGNGQIDHVTSLCAGNLRTFLVRGLSRWKKNNL